MTERRGPSRAMFTRDRDGRMVDEPLHARLLDDPTAHARACAEAVERAMREHGLGLADAQRMYGARA